MSDAPNSSAHSRARVSPETSPSVNSSGAPADDRGGLRPTMDSGLPASPAPGMSGKIEPPEHIWNHAVESESDDGAAVKRERQCCRCGLVHAVYRARDNVWTEFWMSGRQLEHAGGGRAPVPGCAAIVIPKAIPSPAAKEAA